MCEVGEGMCVHVCACAHRFMCLWYSAHLLSTFCFETVSYLTVTHLFRQTNLSANSGDCSVSGFSPCLDFYMGVGAPNRGFHAFTESEKAYLQPHASAFILFLSIP